MELFRGPLEFYWDAGNRGKNQAKHRVSDEECEEVFFDAHKRILKEELHVSSAGREKRHSLVARTKADRMLYVVFTLRRSQIRVISARDVNRKERGIFP